MRVAKNHWSTLILGLVLLFMGSIWALQGIGLIRGSVMTGQSLWVVLGVISALVGVGVVAWSLRASPSKS